jgi:hypothetical protein
MTAKVLSTVAGGLTILMTPWIVKRYAKFSRTPFADDRRNLRKDYENVRIDISKSVQKVKEQHVSEAHCR